MGNLILKNKNSNKIPTIQLDADSSQGTAVYVSAYDGTEIQVKSTPVKVLTTLDISKADGEFTLNDVLKTNGKLSTDLTTPLGQDVFGEENENIVILSTNKQVGNVFTPIYIDADGRIKECISIPAYEDWQQVQSRVRAGQGSWYYPIGYEFFTKQSTGAVAIWRVIGHNICEAGIKPTRALQIGDVGYLTSSYISNGLRSALFKITAIDSVNRKIKVETEDKSISGEYWREYRDLLNEQLKPGNEGFKISLDDFYLQAPYTMTLEMKSPIVGSGFNLGYGRTHLGPVSNFIKNMPSNDSNATPPTKYIKWTNVVTNRHVGADSIMPVTDCYTVVRYLFFTLNSSAVVDIKQNDSRNTLILLRDEYGNMVNTQYFDRYLYHNTGKYEFTNPMEDTCPVEFYHTFFPYDWTLNDNDPKQSQYRLPISELTFYQVKQGDKTPDELQDILAYADPWFEEEEMAHALRALEGTNEYSNSALRKFLGGQLTDTTYTYSPAYTDFWGNIDVPFGQLVPKGLQDVLAKTPQWNIGTCYFPNEEGKLTCCIDTFFPLTDYHVCGEFDNPSMIHVPQRGRFQFTYYAINPDNQVTYNLVGLNVPRLSRTVYQKETVPIINLESSTAVSPSMVNGKNVSHLTYVNSWGAYSSDKYDDWACPFYRKTATSSNESSKYLKVACNIG